MHMSPMIVAVLVVAVILAIQAVLMILKVLRLIALAAIGVGIFGSIRVAIDAWPRFETTYSPAMLIAAAVFALVAAARIGWLIGRRSVKDDRRGSTASATFGHAS